MGVKRIYIDDLREEFVRDYVFPMFRCMKRWGNGCTGLWADQAASASSM